MGGFASGWSCLKSIEVVSMIVRMKDPSSFRVRSFCDNFELHIKFFLSQRKESRESIQPHNKTRERERERRRERGAGKRERGKRGEREGIC